MISTPADASPASDASDTADAPADPPVDPPVETAADRLKARWTEPDAPVPPWYRRVRRRTWIRVGGAAGALVAAGTLMTVLGPDDPARYRLDPPQSIGELTRDPDPQGRFAAMDREMFPDLPGMLRFREHFVTGYRVPGAEEADILVVGATGSFAGPVEELHGLLWASAGNEAAPSPMAGDPSPRGYAVFDPGPLGGYLKCAALGTAPKVTPICAWADQSGTTLGSVSDIGRYGTALDLPALAERTRTIRAAMTHRVEP
ncbi:hypothetical protein ACWEQL_14065 [Kitasatospora sp. NPDC004240]